MKILIFIIKISPIIINFAILISLIFALFDRDISSFTYAIFGHSLYFDLLLLLLSVKMRFCFWHRLLIINMIIIITIEWIDINFNLISSSLCYIQSLLLLTCSSIIGAAILKYKHGHTKKAFGNGH